MKKLLISYTSALLLLFSFITVTAESEIKVFIDNKELEFDVAPVIVEGRTLVPLHVIFEELGMNVFWDESTQTVIAIGMSEDNTVSIALQIDSNTAIVNEEHITLDVPAKLLNEQILVPVRFVAESIGAEVEWNANTRSVVITTQ